MVTRKYRTVWSISFLEFNKDEVQNKYWKASLELRLVLKLLTKSMFCCGNRQFRPRECQVLRDSLLPHNSQKALLSQKYVLHSIVILNTVTS